MATKKRVKRYVKMNDTVIELKITGYYSNLTKTIHKSKSERTKQENKLKQQEYKTKLNNLTNKYNKTW